MDHFKLVSWNIEHADRLIGANLAPKPEASARLDAIAEEIAEMAPDILLVGEGPKGEERAAAFFARVAPDHALVTRGDASGKGYGTKGNQWLWFAIRKGAPLTGRLLHLDRWRALAGPGWGDQGRGDRWLISYPIFDDQAANLRFHVPGTHEHYRHPQVLLAEIALPGGGTAHLEVIGCHLKSKINQVKPRGDAYAPDFFDTQPALVADIMTSRIKLTTEATDIRHYIEARFAAEPDAAIVVAGDLNDGPGKERIEQRFLYHDLVSNLQGDVFLARQFLNHALFDFEDGARWSYDLGRDRLDPARSPRILLDHIMFTQGMTGPDRPGAFAFRARTGGGKVEHDAHHRIAARRPRSAATSDHRAVSMVFDRRAGMA